MQTLGFAIIALGILAFGLVSGRVQRGVLTPPMAFVAFGYLVSEHGIGLVHFNVEESFIHTLAEITLMLVLFSDASRIDLGLLRRQHDLPLRLLGIGLPLTIGLGTLAGVLLLPGLSLWEAALLAAILAPTDAALGQAVVSSPKVPVRIRQALNVESGLNDGIALPVVLVFMSIACATAQVETVGYWVRFTSLQVILGPLVGIAVGYLGGKAVERAVTARWMNATFQGLAALALALLSFSAAELVHGNGFIAAFCAGLALGNTTKVNEHLEEFAETEGQLLTLLIFMIFGGEMLPAALEHATWETFVYAILSLTVIRMLPVLLSLLGSGVRPQTIFFLGWFGPRGIASILFGLLVVQGSAMGEHERLLPMVMITVAFSVFAHGVTANPGSAWYSRCSRERLDEEAVEHKDVEEMPVRLPMAD